ncbi:Hypothetical predicted protein [Lecanosticta acicola]|uniref:RCC1/BLIP-II protein n=1 Tax=Lecanosticta acicola TaxID=111012 RepID=A0AAI9EFK7_9PEZI|nr:Hypothetical predicted protein [Lecanosticta acicola]
MASDGAHHQDQAHGSMRLLAAGFNAHRQLLPREGDVKSFQAVLETPPDNNVRILFAGWSSTVIVSEKTLFSLGHEQLEPSMNDRNKRLRSGFGDHEGMLGCLDDDGHLHLVCHKADSEKGPELVSQSDDDSPLLGNVCYSSSGRVALSFKQAPNSNLCHVAEFACLEIFQRWFADPSSLSNYPQCHYMLPGRPKQLLASTGTFILLMENGEVFTWGDGRYQSLGRPVTGDGAVSADKPGALEALGGLQITKVATGGWMNAALSKDGALYVWGTTSPEAAGGIECLGASDSGEVSLVEIPDSNGEPLDVLDVALGDNHIAVGVEGGRLFMVGDNQNGQLGLDEKDFIADWREWQ